VRSSCFFGGGWECFLAAKLGGWTMLTCIELFEKAHFGV
jgi:hypothetical protein